VLFGTLAAGDCRRLRCVRAFAVLAAVYGALIVIVGDVNVVRRDHALALAVAHRLLTIARRVGADGRVGVDVFEAAAARLAGWPSALVFAGGAVLRLVARGFGFPWTWTWSTTVAWSPSW
jgi:hypothetical protein